MALIDSSHKFRQQITEMAQAAAKRDHSENQGGASLQVDIKYFLSEMREAIDLPRMSSEDLDRTSVFAAAHYAVAYASLMGVTL